MYPVIWLSFFKLCVNPTLDPRDIKTKKKKEEDIRSALKFSFVENC